MLFFCIAPVLTLAALNLLHLYPVNSRRLMLFLLPCVSVGLVLLLETLRHEAYRFTSYRIPNSVSMGFGVVCVLASLVLAAQPVLWHITQTEDVEGAVQYLKSTAQQEDLIFVHGSAVESVKLYLNLLKWPAAPVVFGVTGFPCCIRERQMEEGNADSTAIRQDVARMIEKPAKGRLWLMSGCLAGSELQVQLDYLRVQGCAAQQERSFTQFKVYRLVCQPPQKT